MSRLFAQHILLSLSITKRSAPISLTILSNLHFSSFSSNSRFFLFVISLKCTNIYKTLFSSFTTERSNSITKRKNLELELKEEKNKLDNIVSEIGADLLVIDRNNKICWANKRLKKNHPLGRNILNRTCFDTYCHFESAPADCP